MVNKYKLKRLSIDAYDQIIKLWADAGLPFKPQGRDSREFMEKEMNQPMCAFFGLFDTEKMIAVGIANFDGRRGWVNRVAVDPDYRGRRIAGQVIEACENFLYDSGALVICALIEEENKPSMSAFDFAGYTCEIPIKYWTKRRSMLD